MTIKKTLIEIVKEILSDMDSEDVNSISDSVEAQQVASIVQSTYYNIISTRDIAHHDRLIKLSAYSDTDYPTHYSYADTIKNITTVWYNVGTLAAPEWREIKFLEPEDFLKRSDSVSEDCQVVAEPTTGVLLKIQTNAHPFFYTTFDDTNLVFNSFDNTVEDTLQESKLRVLGSVFPTFTVDDDHTPNLAPQYFPYLIAESKSMAFDVLKGGTTPKVDQAARRQKAYVQNDKYRTREHFSWPNYGRK